MNARGAAPAFVRAGALALLAACGGGSERDASTRPDVQIPGPCSPSFPAMPVTHIGPDITLHAACGQAVTSAFASVDDRGAGITYWSVHLETATPKAFMLTDVAFQTCQGATGPSIASIIFQAPAGAVPGDAFDAVVRVHAEDGSFPDGTVKVHGEVAAPIVTIDPPVVEFGDVLPGVRTTRPLVFFFANEPANAVQSAAPGAPFQFDLRPFTRAQPHVSAWVATFQATGPGDYSAVVPFWTAHTPTQPTACEWSTTITVHARVVIDAGAADGGADAGDGP